MYPDMDLFGGHHIEFMYRVITVIILMIAGMDGERIHYSSSAGVVERSDLIVRFCFKFDLISDL